MSCDEKDDRDLINGHDRRRQTPRHPRDANVGRSADPRPVIIERADALTRIRLHGRSPALGRRRAGPLVSPQRIGGEGCIGTPLCHKNHPKQGISS
jgi:hypothetical protein